MYKQSLITILFAVLMSIGGTKAYAHDIEVVNADGVTIFYNYINDGKDLEVAPGAEYFDGTDTRYKGSVNIPENVTFMGRTRKVTSIGQYAFSSCTGLKSVTIPNSVTSIGNSAFSGCSGLSSVSIPNSVTSIGQYAFSGCSGLKTVKIGNSVTIIGDYAFYECSGLTSVTIPNSVTSIGNYAFKSCNRLTSITIGDNVSRIGEYAFRDCEKLTSVNIHSIAAWCNIIFRSADSNPLYYAHHLFLDGSEIIKLEIPSSVTSIGHYAFYKCSGLTSVTIPNSVTSIGYEAFDFSDIQSVISYIAKPFSIEGKSSFFRAFSQNTFNNATLCVPEGSLNNYKSIDGWKDFLFIEEIPSGGINGLNYSLDHEKLTATVVYNASYSGNIVIPNSITPYGALGASYSVTSIGEGTFLNCSGLTSVTIPNSVTNIGKSSFYGCKGMTSVYITDLEAWCKISFSDNPLNYAHHLYLNGEEIKDLVIPNSVTSIGNSAFSGCSGLSSVSIPNSVTSIGQSAFSGCSGLSSVSIPNSVTSIGKSSFYGCKGLTSVHITDLAAWCKISFSDNPLNYAHHLYLNKEEIKDLVIPNSVKSISELAFSGCSGLTSVNIPNSVTTIGGSAFYSCSGLVSVTFGEIISSIQSKSFANCSKLTDVYCLAEVVPNTTSGAFENSSINNATLHVHAVSLDNYKETEPWKNFKDIVSIEPKCPKPTITYNNGKISFSCETEGVEFHYSISGINYRSGVGSEVLFSPNVTLSVYASKYGFPNSDTATMKLAVPSNLTGDLNGDGEVNADDHEILSNIILER